jgi:hypothetical protein
MIFSLGFIVAVVESQVEIGRVAKACQQRGRATLSSVQVDAQAATLPGVVRMIVQLDDIENSCIVNEMLCKSSGTHAMMVFANSRFFNIYFALKCIVDNRN